MSPSWCNSQLRQTAEKNFELVVILQTNGKNKTKQPKDFELERDIHLDQLLVPISEFCKWHGAKFPCWATAGLVCCPKEKKRQLFPAAL